MIVSLYFTSFCLNFLILYVNHKANNLTHTYLHTTHGTIICYLGSIHRTKPETDYTSLQSDYYTCKMLSCIMCMLWSPSLSLLLTMLTWLDFILTKWWMILNEFKRTISLKKNKNFASIYLYLTFNQKKTITLLKKTVLRFLCDRHLCNVWLCFTFMHAKLVANNYLRYLLVLLIWYSHEGHRSRIMICT
jgi:hypothetical protein